MKKIISFSGMICYLYDVRLSIDEFKNSINETVINKDIIDDKIENRVQIFRLEYIGNFLKIFFSDGSSMPRSPKVYDKETRELENNPRNKNQIEPKEYFALIDFNTSFLWLSNTSKKTSLVNYFKRYFSNSELKLKDIYNEQEFINTLEMLDGIKISVVPNLLFVSTNTLSKALSDEMYPASKAELSLTYNKIGVLEKIKDKILNIFKNKDSFESITISGRDKKGLEILFNNNSFSRKISVESEVDDDGMFCPGDVFEKLIDKITKEMK